MALSENVISRAIIESYSAKLLSHLEVDVAMVGGGPSALTAARILAKRGKKVAVFERHLAPGGGVWGGGMLFNNVVVQDDVLDILDEIGVGHKPVDNTPGYNTVDSVELASGLIFSAIKAGAVVFNSMAVEDVVFKDGRVSGLVLNWGPVQKLGMFVDPLMVTAKCVLDGTGHPCEVINLATRKAQIKLDTPTGGILGEKPMWADSGEVSTVENTREYFPGLFASGMSANNVMGGYRMGPIFGGMIKSGVKAADLITKALETR